MICEVAEAGEILARTLRLRATRSEKSRSSRDFFHNNNIDSFWSFFYLPFLSVDFDCKLKRENPFRLDHDAILLASDPELSRKFGTTSKINIKEVCTFVS